MVQLTEYQSKTILARFGLPVQSGVLVSTSERAAEAAVEFGSPVVVKAQLPVGGRGKAGAILRADSPPEAAAAFKAVTAVQLEDMRAVEALIEPWMTCAAEYYLSVVIDGEAAAPIAVFSAAGGMDVEAAHGVLRIPLRDDGSVAAAPLRRAAYAAGVTPRAVEQLIAVAHGLARACAALDAKLIEVNPLGQSASGQLLALDARLVVDDHALYRQPELRQIVEGTRPRRLEDLVRDATRLEYVRLGGSLGLISGGAGMTMTVMDLIAEMGGEPACFLDCSANPTSDGYGAALDLLLGDPNVRGILISIFGGLTQVDRVARTLVKLLAERAPAKPITLRLMGTNVETAEATLEAAGLVNHRDLTEAVTAAISTVESRGETAKAA